MGHFLSRIRESFIFQQDPCQIAVLGLDAAGKTTILHKLKRKNEEPIIYAPTIGFYSETVTSTTGVKFTAWDLGCAEKKYLLLMWKRLNIRVDGILFVVDSNHKDRLPEARDELHRVFADENTMLYRVPVVVVANKQDLTDVISPDKLIDQLYLQKLSGNPWLIQGACALNGDGLDEAVCALVEMVKQYKNYHDLDER